MASTWQDIRRQIKELAKAHNVKKQFLLVLAPKNDPFNCGTKANIKMGRWFAEMWRRYDGKGRHVRKLHYLMVGGAAAEMWDGQPYINTEYCWNKLEQAGKIARYLGLVPMLDIVDNRTPDPIIPAGRQEEAAELGWWVAPAEFPEIRADTLLEYLREPTALVQGYDYHRADQPYHVEVWIEKQTMNDELQPLCDSFHMVLVPGQGQGSVTSVARMMHRVAIAKKPARIFYISDFDPAGDDMPRAVARKIEYIKARGLVECDQEIKLIRLALTREQVVEYDLPRTPIKDGDMRKQDFEGDNGAGCVELDALEALHPGELYRIVRDAVMQYRDLTLPNRTALAEQQAQSALNDVMAAWRPELDAIKADAVEILDRYARRAEELNAEMQAELQDSKDRFEKVRHAVQNTEIELSLRPEADIDLPDESRVLYDSGRSYREQWVAYRADKKPRFAEDVYGRAESQ